MKFSKTITFSIALSIIGVAYAEWLDESTVKTAAEAFTSNDAIGSTILKGCTVAGLTQRQYLWIVSLEPSGHIVMSGSDLADPIVGFSKNNFTDPDPDSPAYSMLEGSSAAVAAKEAQGGTRHARWTKLLGSRGRPLLKADAVESPGTVMIEPFLKSHYNQCQPYNDYAPVYDAETNITSYPSYRGRCPCGCVATATAQFFKHFHWPARIDRVDYFNHNFTDTNKISTTFPIRFDGHLPIDWAELEDNYIFYASDSYDLRGTVKEYTRYPIARLVMFSDVLAQMSFTSDGSGADYNTVADNISEWYVKGNWVNVKDKAQQIKTDIMAGVPCHISIAYTDEHNNRIGHQVVAHGWAESGNIQYLYINFGWGGSNDGYYNLAEDIQEFTEKRAYVGHYPRAKPQLDQLPKVCETSTTLNWHFPDFYTNKLDGFTVSISKPATEPSTFEDNFSNSSGSSSSADMYIGKDSDYGYDGNLLYTKATTTGTYTFQDSYTLTSASVMTLKLLSFSAFGAVYEIQASFDGGDWETICTPLLQFDWGSSGWATERVYLGGHGGESVRFRVRNSRNSLSYYPTGRILLDDFTVTNVLALEAEVQHVGKTARSLVLDGLVEGATYWFTVTPNISDALVDGETSEPVSTVIAGTRNTPNPGEQTYTQTDLVFSTNDTSASWSYSGTTVDDTTILDKSSCSISVAIFGMLKASSSLSFGWSANNYYGNGSDTLTAVFSATNGTATTLWTTNNTANSDWQNVNVSLGELDGLSGKLTITYNHSGSYYVGDQYGGRLYAPQITNVLVPSVPDVAWKEETLTALGTPEISSVSPVKEGFYRECGLEATTFEVICSSSVTNLTARPSHLALVRDEDVVVTRNGNGRFTVTITPSGVNESNLRSRMILTLAATDANGTTTYKDLSLRFSNEAHEDESPVVVVVIDTDRMEEPVVNTETGVRTIAAKDGEKLTQNDVETIMITATIPGEASPVDTTAGYNKTLVNNEIVITLKVPEIAQNKEDDDKKEDGDATGMLLGKDKVTLDTDEPTPTQDDIAKGQTEVAALPVDAIKGLWYQASWGDSLTGMDSGEKVQATGDSLYLGVIKQTGDKGFYKISVSEE